ncbi:MAG TPA: glycosyl hydrolase [Tepidisphaeraceae bacterium]|jgi:hypothetical protein
MNKWMASLLAVAVGSVAGTVFACSKCSVGSPEPAQTYFGLNADPIGASAKTDAPKFLQALKDSGAGSVRIPVRWSQLEPQRGQWNFEAADAVLAGIPDDVEVLGVLMSVPAWANGTSSSADAAVRDATPAKNLEDWKNYVATTVKHCKSKIRHWEVWPGGNGDGFQPKSDVAAYVQILKAGYETAKQTDPGCIVILGGLDGDGVAANPLARHSAANFLESLYQAGAQKYFDACNIHPYVLPLEGAARMMELARDAEQVMAKYGDDDKPLYLTEVGSIARDGETQAAQSRLLEEVYQAARKDKQLCHVFWYSLHDDQRATESTMGLIATDWTRKPGFEAFVKAAHEKTIR